MLTTPRELDALVNACMLAHEPAKTSRILGLEDVRAALVAAGADTHTLEQFDARHRGGVL
jgi:hypothetical protein